jgi:hypothetical protein
MPEVRNEYPFQISYEDGRLPRSLIVLRAETAAELALSYLAVLAQLDEALGKPEAQATPAQASAPPPPPPPAEDKGATCTYEGCGKTMEWRTGEKDGVPWKGWFCPTRNRAHKAIWA